jgi:hypothetical protein
MTAELQNCMTAELGFAYKQLIKTYKFLIA